MAGEHRVVAVVVTWNRRDLLEESLEALEKQHRPPDRVVVVDNCSTDGTADMVRERHPHVDLVTLATNTGGAGGFAVGIRHALAADADLLWLMDDDTVPEPSALEAAIEAYDGYPGDTRPSLVASRVVWTDGRPHPMNTPRRKPGARRGELDAAAAVGSIPVRSASFVSVLVDAARVRERGLPMAAYFLWNDDFEYTTRLIRGGRGIICPASVAVHKTKVFGATEADPGERFYFEVRNKVWTLARSRGLSVPEKVMYGGSAVRRWARTFAGSDDRRTLLRGLRRGLADGVRTAPTPTEDILAGLRTPPREPGTTR
ncbi:MAG: glycosyltransferase [Propionibacteriales bacterium]|nr:glycosyltransferase [Propionibacteriales bacterium]